MSPRMLETGVMGEINEGLGDRNITLWHTKLTSEIKKNYWDSFFSPPYFSLPLTDRSGNNGTNRIFSLMRRNTEVEREVE